jgi:mRNA interferase MazF
MQMDELLLENSDFADGAIPKDSKVMIRKTFVVSKSVIVKKYGSLKKESFERIFHQFCKYFACA